MSGISFAADPANQDQLVIVAKNQQTRNPRVGKLPTARDVIGEWLPGNADYEILNDTVRWLSYNIETGEGYATGVVKLKGASR